MSEFEFLEKLRDEELLKFKKCVRKLLDSTFLVEDKDPELFDYLSYSSNRVNMSAYLRIMGYDILVDDDFKYAMLIQNESDIDTVGLKRISHVQFSNHEVLILLVLWMLFLERFGRDDKTYVELSDVVDLMNQYGIEVAKTELKNGLRTFKRYSLIDYSEADYGEHMAIRLYPTLQFAMNKEQFLAVAKELTAEVRTLETEEDSNSESMEDSE